MFLALLYSLIIHQTVTLASPFHKYPYVFLLDIGNEELQTKSEQIRVSVPGGSLALRIPAIGEGDSIAHVRVSGIDFDNDLKANIVDGGPGYKYVVIVFMANPGRAYDAVVTVSTLDNEYNDKDTEADTNPAGTDEEKSTYKVAQDNEEVANDSAEQEEHKSDESNEQLTSASNFYDSAENLDDNGKENEDNADIHVNSRDEVVKIDNDAEDTDSAAVNDYIDSEERNKNNDYDYANDPRAETYNVNEDNADSEDNDEGTKELDSTLYDKYNALRPHLYVYAKAPQEINNAENEVEYNVDDNDGVVYSPEDPVELDQMFNDEEVHNDAGRYSDSNNNNYADAENSAVAY